MALHSRAFAVLQLLLIASLLPHATANEANWMSLCSEMRIYDQQLQNQLRVLTSTHIQMSMLNLLAKSFANTNLQQYVKDVVDIGLVLKADYYTIDTAKKLIEAASYYGNRKAEIVRKAIEYGGSYWWQARFFDEKLGKFDRVKALSWITDHHRYKLLLWNFKGWHEKKADRHCRQSTVKALFEFESRRLMPITDPQDFERLLTAVCEEDGLNWKEFFLHDELRNAEPKVLLAFLEHGRDLMRAIDTTAFSLWSLSPICQEVANCRGDEQCLRHTSRLVARAVPLPGMTPGCLAAIKRTGIKAGIEKNSLLEYVDRFLAEVDFPKECGQSFAEIVVRSYQMQSEGAGADGKAVGGTVRMVLDLAKENGWASEDTNRLLAAVAKAALRPDEPAKFLRVTGLKTADEYLELLGLFLISEKQDLAGKQASIPLDIKGMLDLMKVSQTEKQLVEKFFRWPQKCRVDTIRLLAEVVKAQAYPVYLGSDGYAALFEEVCTKEAAAVSIMYRDKSARLDRIREDIRRA